MLRPTTEDLQEKGRVSQETPAMTTGSRRSFETLLLTGVLLLGLSLRAWGVADQSLSMDEFAELDTAAQPVAVIVGEVDGFPPLYQLILRGWTALWGDEGGRWLSVLFGVSTIPIVWLLGRRLGGVATGLWSAFLLATSPFHIWYSQEARSYVLYILLAAATMWLLLRALETDRIEDWGLYAAVSVAGMYVHYYFVLILLIGAIVILWRRRGLGALRRPVAAHVAIGFLAIPLLWILDHDLVFQTGFPDQTSFGIGAWGYTYVSLITGYSLGPSLRELHAMNLREALVAFAPWLLVLVPMLAVLARAGARALPRPALGALALFLLVSVPLIGLIGIVAGVGYNVRYVAWTIIPFLLWLGAGATRWRSWPVGATLAALICLSALAIWNRHHLDRYRNEDIRAATTFIAARSGERVPVFTLAGYMWKTAGYYLGRDYAVYPLPDASGDSLRVTRAIGLIRALTPAGSPYWLVYSRAFHGDPNGAVKDALEDRHGLEPAARFSGAVLYRGVVPAGTSSSDPRRSEPRRSAS